MATRKKPPKATAAVAEVEEKPEAKSIEWQGLTLSLPERPPQSLLFRSIQAEDGDGPQPMLKMLKRMVGDEQFEAVIRTIEHADDEDEVIASAFGLVGDIFALYGADEGE